MQNIITFCVAAVFVLLPVQFLVLPMNMSPADLVGFVTLPLCWVLLLHQRKQIVYPLAPAMYATLAVSGIAVLTSIDPAVSVATLVKELYLYWWVVTVATVYAASDSRGRRRLLWAWLIGIYANGALILVQFVSPGVLAAMNSAVAGRGSFDLYRPSGFTPNANAAALFQMTAFVPLVALRLPRGRLLVLGLLLLLTMLGTGSMGAVSGFAAGLAVGLLGMLVFMRDWRNVVQFVVASILGAAVLAVVVMACMELVPGFSDRIEYVITGRGEGSAAGRFDIWRGGVDLFLSDLNVFGVGPDAYRLISGKELHNDSLAFLVERGPLGLFTLLLLAAAAIAHAVQLARRGRRIGDASLLVYLPGLVAMAAVAMTHEIFHQRPLWMVLALQEACWFQARRDDRRADAAATPFVHRRPPLTTRSTVSIT